MSDKAIGDAGRVEHSEKDKSTEIGVRQGANRSHSRSDGEDSQRRMVPIFG